MRSALWAAMIGMSACTWVSSKDFDARLPEMDDDGDGFTVAAGDCDDADPGKSPGVVETWYDGIDANCDELNDYDFDADGVEQEVDCDDADPSVYPGAADSWYDGEDNDCGGDDDYDRDLDGYVDDAYVGLSTGGVNGSGALPGGDCDDGSAAINPDQPDEWYNGIDEDCGGEDDFDQDGDGYIYDDYVGLATIYVTGSGSLPGGECDDQVSSVHPGAVDSWYDGTDSDCGGEDDFDQDFDGYVPNSYYGDTTVYVEGSGALPAGDCDDGAADVLPGATELLGDGVDQDCDSGVDSFVLDGLDDVLEVTLTEADTPRLSANSGAVYLAFTANLATLKVGTETTEVENGVPILSLDRGDLHTLTDATVYSMLGATTNEPDHQLDFQASEDYLYGGFAQVYTKPGYDYLSLRLGIVDLATGLADGNSGGSTEDAAGYDLRSFALRVDEDEENAYLFASFTADPAIYAHSILDDYRVDGDIEYAINAQVLGLDADAVGLDLRPAESDYPILLAGVDGALLEVPLEIDASTQYHFDADGSADLTSTESLPYDPEAIRVIQDPDGATWRVFYDNLDKTIYALDEDDVATTIKSGFTAAVPVSAAFAADGRLFVVWASSGDATLVYGTPISAALDGANEVTLTTDFSITEAAVWADTAADGDGLDLVVGVLSSEKIALGTARVLAP